MPTRTSDWRLFLSEFRRNFRTTGAVLPSGGRLSAALAHFVRARSGEAGRRILEVGPGTGAVTRHIVEALGPNDRLDLVELNDSFVARLRDRFENDPAFKAVAERTRILHCPVQELPQEPTYQVIVSGLPLNNFAVEEVRGILSVLGRLACPQATLSFFEYIGIRRMKAAVSGATERVRLRGIAAVEGELLASREIRRDWVLRNVPPAWVHHVQF